MPLPFTKIIPTLLKAFLSSLTLMGIYQIFQFLGPLGRRIKPCNHSTIKLPVVYVFVELFFIPLTPKSQRHAEKTNAKTETSELSTPPMLETAGSFSHISLGNLCNLLFFYTEDMISLKRNREILPGQRKKNGQWVQGRPNVFRSSIVDKHFQQIYTYILVVLYYVYSRIK